MAQEGAGAHSGIFGAGEFSECFRGGGRLVALEFEELAFREDISRRLGSG